MINGCSNKNNINISNTLHYNENKLKLKVADLAHKRDSGNMRDRKDIDFA